MPRHLKRHPVIASALSLGLVLAGAATVAGVASAPSSFAAGGLTATFEAVSFWDGGYEGKYTVTNSTGAAVHGWTLEFDLENGGEISSLWDGTSPTTRGHITVSPVDWNSDIEPGESVSTGFTISGSDWAPGGCLINGGSCTGAPAPVPGQNDPKPTTPAPAPPAPAGPGWNAAPFTYVGDGADLAAWSRATGVKHYNLAFAVAPSPSTCGWQWDGNSDPDLAGKIAALRAAGGDVAISLGGAGSYEPAQACGDEQALAGVYRSLMNTYGVDHLDFDIETLSAGHPDADTRRGKALKILQDEARAAGRQLVVSYTVGTGPEGLGGDALTTIDRAGEQGVVIDAVNLMVMDYGGSGAGQMERYAEQAATNTYNLLLNRWHLSPEATWKKIALTPMIGQNDSPGEVFSTADARALVDFARSKHLNWLGYWKVSRDHACTAGETEVGSCSHVPQAEGEFSKIFAGYTG